MILPAKHLSANRALLTLGAKVLAALEEPQTVSALWDRLRASRDFEDGKYRISYEWFILSLDLLFLVSAIQYENGIILRTAK